MTTQPLDTTQHFAVISAACRFPQANTIEQYWSNLQAGKACFTKIPKNRFDVDAFYHPEPLDSYATYQRYGTFVDDIYSFDNDFFNVKPHDAICMDPQQRISLELTQELFDRAGYSQAEITGQNIGVFIGAADLPYYRENLFKMNAIGGRSHAMLTLSNMVSGRISDFYDFKGESMTMNTACSTSLVSIQMACRALLCQNVDMAIAGGIQLNEDELDWVSFSKSKTLAHGDAMYVFDERADGFILGEGAGLVLLKRYDDAVRDGDIIKAVIIGLGINNDGKTMGVISPSLKGQKAVIEFALKNAKISPESIGYYEAHGTGTPMGDRIELKAASEAYRAHTDKIAYCAIASVKSMIGHLALAAGIASFIKLVLSLENKLMPPTLNCETPNPRCNFETSPFYLNTSLKQWASEQPRRAAVSGFGFGGTNAHLILQEGPSLKMTRQPLPITKFQRKYYSLKNSTLLS